MLTTTTIPEDILCGRTVLRTDLTTFDEVTLKEDLQRVLKGHAYNRERITILQNYHKGYHPYVQEREKTTRTDVDNKITVNHAWAFTRDITGHWLGKPVEFTHRKNTAAGRKQMEKLNAALDAEGKSLVDYQVAEHMSISGLGFKWTGSESEAINGTALKLLALDPLDTFVVYHSDPTKGAAYAVSSYLTVGENEMEKVVWYNVYTPTKLYRFKDNAITTTGTGGDPKFVGVTDINVGGGLPIVEYPNNQWRLGDWEVAIALMDALDCVTSDGVNDIQQAVNSVLVAMGMELDAEAFAALSKNGFLNVKDIPVGVKPVVEFISQAMDANVGSSLREYLEATLRTIVGVPDRKTRGGGGGDTGDAVYMRDGWQDIDLVATSKEQWFMQAERSSIATMLYILSTKNEVTGLKAADIVINFNRNKQANIQSKSQVYQTLTTGDAPLAPIDALEIADLTNNESDVILRAEQYAKENAERRMNEAIVSKTATQPNSTEGGSPNTGGATGTDKGSGSAN